jgi:hypothetical protein
VVFRPGWPECCPWAVQDLVGALAQHGDRSSLHRLRVVDVDVETAGACELGQDLAIHDGVGARFVGGATLDRDVFGELRRPGSQRDRRDGPGQSGGNLVERG